MWVTNILADYITSFRPEDVSPAAREMAGRCVLDLMGAVAAGFDNAPVRAMRSAASKLFAVGLSRLWFAGSKLHAAAAAMVNAEAASALDVDDGNRAAGGHPGASIIPAAIAVAEETGARGEDLIAAIVLGYEVGVRVAAARDLAALDTFSTGRWCSMGAAAAGGFLRRLSPDRLAEALAIAGVKSPGLSASGYSKVMGNHVKEGIPWSTLTGLTALDLAEEGFTGPTDLFDHPAYYDRGKILAGLGEGGFAIERVYFKPYSCCRWIHSALDALLGMTAESGIAPREIERVEVQTFGRALRLNNYSEPDTLEGAQYSVPFSLAVAAVRGAPALLPMRADCLGDPEIVAFARKVELSVDPELDRAFPDKAAARVILETANGRFERLVEDALGDPANPMERPRLEAKFRTLSGGILSGPEQDEIIDATSHLGKNGLSRISRLLGIRKGVDLRGKNVVLAAPAA